MLAAGLKAILQVFRILFSAAEARLLSPVRVGWEEVEIIVERGFWVRQRVLSSRPVANVNRIVARTAFRSGVQALSSVGVFPPR